MTINKLSVNELFTLRANVEKELANRRRQLENDIELIRGFSKPEKSGRSPMLGRKVAAKYKGPKGETWAGRGAKPRWLTALLKDKKNKLENYRIKSAA